MKSFILSLVSLFSFSYCLTAQDLLQQNCTGAIPICDMFITQTVGYQGPGTNANELPPSTCLENGENNSVWYTFTTDTAGSLQFAITPINPTDDYDFALFNITNHTCADIRTDSFLEVRCNYSLNDTDPGGPGDSTGIGYWGYGTSSGAAGPTFNAAVVVSDTPQTFVLLINDFTSGGSGYTIDFTQSTTKFTVADYHLELTNPYDTVCQDIQSVLLSTNHPVACNSITSACCTMLGPLGVDISSVTPSNCNAGFTNELSIDFSDTIPGNSDIQIVINDSSLLPFGCASFQPATDTLHLHVLPFQHLGFSLTVSNDTAYITDSAVGVDTYYSLLSLGSLLGNYGSGTEFIVLEPNNYYQLCQYPYIDSNVCPGSSSCQAIDLLGINSTSPLSKINILPNPTTGIVHVTLPSSNNITYLQVYDVMGELVSQQQIPPGNTTTDIDLGNQAQGVYLLKIQQGSEQGVRRVVKF